MRDVAPTIEWQFPDDEDEKKTFHTSGPLPRPGDVVTVMPRRTVAGKTTEMPAERYVVDRIEWSIFDKRDDTATMGTRLDVFAVVILRATDAA